MIWPELTTVHRPIADMAREAVRLLIEQVRAKRSGRQPATEHRLMKYTLVKRDASGPAPKRKTKH